MVVLVTPLTRAAVDLVDDDVLRHVGELAGEVTRVGGLECGVGQTLAGAVGGGEIFQHATGLRGSWP